jgi:hypothetical protein
MTIKKTGDKYTVFSEKGKRLSKPSSKKSAKHRLAQIEAFKHMKKSGAELTASAMTLKVDSEKAGQANRINVDTDAYKGFMLEKGLHSNGFVRWGYGLWRNQVK